MKIKTVLSMITLGLTVSLLTPASSLAMGRKSPAPPKGQEPAKAEKPIAPVAQPPAAAPKVEAPKPAAPAVQPPAAAPKVEAPKPAAPDVQPPAAAPKVEAPKPVAPDVQPPAAAPKVEAPKPAEPAVQPPAAPAGQPPATGPTVAAPTSTPGGPQPKIVFEKKEYDFGEVIGVDKVEHIYKFTNEGKGDLKIDKVNTTCGCTAALLSANTVPPGGKGEVTATFTVGGRQGAQTKHIYVLSNDPADPKATLTLKGTITPQVSVEPSSISISDKEKDTSRTVTIAQTTDESLTLGEISQRLNLVTTKLTEGTPEKGKKRYTLEIGLKPDTNPGRYFETVSVATNLKAKPKIDINVRIVVNGDIQATPSRINLGSLKPGQEISKTIALNNIKGQPFKVEAVEIDNKDFTITPAAPVAAAETHTFTLTGKAPAATQGVVRAKIIFKTDNPKQKEIEASLYGYIPKETGGAQPPEDEKTAAPAPKN
ncbi:MAG: DUF1573 domain-containing protein [Candidatus Aureabacteria bacterium]|nr:DUF1573 domain-containing protein [Candidatus Auribacterota bacterium]